MDASDSFLMELSPYPRRFEAVGPSQFMNRIVNGWPNFGAQAELRFGTNGALGVGQAGSGTRAQCVAGSTYGTEANQPCGANSGAWGETQMEVYYRCGEGSGNGPCPWDAPPPPAVSTSYAAGLATFGDS